MADSGTRRPGWWTTSAPPPPCASSRLTCPARRTYGGRRRSRGPHLRPGGGGRGDRVPRERPGGLRDRDDRGRRRCDRRHHRPFTGEAGGGRPAPGRTGTADRQRRRRRTRPGGTRGTAAGPTVTNAFAALGPERQAALYEELRRTVPLHRLGTPTELAKAAVYLASDESAYTAGTVLRVDSRRRAEDVGRAARCPSGYRPRTHRYCNSGRPTVPYCGRRSARPVSTRCSR
nr:SDR family oxidoreductase [Streptomyces sp. CRN 30]